MWLTSRIVLLALVTLLSVFGVVKSDSRTFPLSPYLITNMCDRDTVQVLFLLDASSSTSAQQYADMIAHARSIGYNLVTFNSQTGAVGASYVASVYYYSTTLTPAGGPTGIFSTLDSYFTIASGGLSTVNPRNTASAVLQAANLLTYSAITPVTPGSVYARKIIYVLTTGLPNDTNQIYAARRKAEALGVEIFIEAYGSQAKPIKENYVGQLTGLATAPFQTHFINTTGVLTNTVDRVVSSIRREIGGTCSVFANTNIVTYDGQAYTPSANGYSVLTQTLQTASSEPFIRAFTVVANIAENDVIITTNGDAIRFVWSKGQLSSTLNGEQITLNPGPNNFLDTQIDVELSQLITGSLGMVINVTSNKNDVVQLGFYDAPYILVQPAGDLFGKVVGLCGTWDNCPNNEYITGTAVTSNFSNINAFVYSWNVPNENYNTQLYATASVANPPPRPPQESSNNVAMEYKYVYECNGVNGLLAKFCAYDFGRIGAAATAVYQSLQASTCEEYCQNGFISSSYFPGSSCDSYCIENYPPFDLHNVTDIPFQLSTTQSPAGFQNHVGVYLGGRYVIKATDPQGIVDYTTLEFNCSEELVNVSAGPDVTVTRSTVFGFPTVQLQGKVPQSNVNRPIQYSWKAVQYPYIGQDDNTTSQLAIDTQAPVIISGLSLAPRFTPLFPGVYVFTLAAYDGCMIRYSNVTVTAVCDNCPFTARVNPAPTSFYDGNLGFDAVSYNSFLYNAPQYLNPDYTWRILNIKPYNVRNENLTVVYDPEVEGSNTRSYHIVFTTGIPYPLVNTSTIPTLVSAGLASSDDVSPYRAKPITLTDGLVIHPTPAIIQKAHHHTWVYSTVTQTENVVAVPLTDFSATSVCDIDLNFDGGSAFAFFNPTRTNGFVDYCTGRYTIEMYTSDVCHNSSDNFVTQVNCDSRPILNAPACKNKQTVVYDNTLFGTTGWVSKTLDGSTPYDTEETFFYYNWTLVSRPALSSVTTACTGQTCTVLPDYAGDYVFNYTISDGCRAEYAIYTLIATCELDPRFITQTVEPTSINYNGVRETVTVDGTNSTLAKRAQYQTIVTRPVELNSLPPWGTMGGSVNSNSGTFVPTAKGTWSVTLSSIDQCGILNYTTQDVTVTCPGVTSTDAVIEPSTTEVETSGPAFPTVTLDGTKSSIVSTSYTVLTPTYYWYYRLASSNDVNDYVRITSTAGIVGFSAPTAGTWQILLIFSDGCEYVTETVEITANCNAPIPNFEIDQFYNPGNRTEPPAGTFYFFGGGLTPLTLNASASENVTNYQWVINSVHGDVYTYTVYSLPVDTGVETTLDLLWPTPSTGTFTVTLVGSNQCPGGKPVSTNPVPILTTCNIIGYTQSIVNTVVVGADKPTVGFQASNRFDSSTITAANLDPNYISYRRFLVTQAPVNSIYAPYVDLQRSTTVQSVPVVTTGKLNNTGFSGNYQITTVTSTTTVASTWIWIELEYTTTNSSYYACFTPDLPGTYVITTEIRDFCNNTVIKTTTITAGCPTAITPNFAQSINVSVDNFRDLARVTIDASGLSNPAVSDLKYRWELSAANGSYYNSYNGSYYSDIELDDSMLTNYYGSVVSFVLPYTTYNNTYYARYDIWDGCQMISGNVNVTIPATSHRGIFVAPVSEPDVNSTEAIKVQSEDSIAVSTSQYLSAVSQQLRQTECFSDAIEYEMVQFQAYQQPEPAPKKKGVAKGVIIGAVIGSVAGAAIIGAAVVGVMKYKARSVAV